MPVANADVAADYAPLQQGEGPVRHLTHFSLAMSASRRFCRWVAWNVDGNGLQQLSRTGIEFKRDPAYRAEHQVDDDLYANNRLDRGHIARRSDLLWGTREEAQRANTDSFLFTNIAPQLDDFNQSVKHGLWGQLEDAIYEGVSVDDLRLSVVGGPIFKRNDLEYRGVLVPRSYWKAIAYVEDETLKAKAYVLTQDDLEGKLESLGLEPFNLYQVAIRELGAMTGLDYGPLITADTMAPSAPDAQVVTARADRGALRDRPLGGRRQVREPVELGQRHDALLLVRVRARDHGLQRLIAEVRRQVRHARGDVDEVAGLDHLVVLERWRPTRTRRAR